VIKLYKKKFFVDKKLGPSSKQLRTDVADSPGVCPRSGARKNFFPLQAPFRIKKIFHVQRLPLRFSHPAGIQPGALGTRPQVSPLTTLRDKGAAPRRPPLDPQDFGPHTGPRTELRPLKSSQGEPPVVLPRNGSLYPLLGAHAL